MALTLDVLEKDTLGNSGVVKLVDVTFDASYPAGGEALAPADLGMSRIDAVFCDQPDGFVAKYDRTNSKLKALRGADLASSSEVAGQDESSDNTYTVTGVLATDRLVSVLHISTAAAVATIEDVTADFSITDDDEISGDGATDRSNDQLAFTWQSDRQSEVSATTDLSAVSFRALVLGR